jgi:hypothetical protein
LGLKAVNRFDLIRFHIDDLYVPLSRHQSIVRVTILHGRLDIPDLVPLYQEFPETPVISIANAQREPLPWLHWQGMMYHRLPEDFYTLRRTISTSTSGWCNGPFRSMRD